MRDPRYDILFEPVPARPGDRPQPLLPGAALQRDGPPPPDRPCAHARREGRGRLGRRLHRGGRDPPVVRGEPLHRGAPLGRRRHPGPGADDREDPRARVAGRDRARATTASTAREHVHAARPGWPSATCRCRTYDPVQVRRMGARRHRRPAALAPGGGAAVARGRVRRRLRVRGARPRTRSGSSCRASTTSAPTATAAASRTAPGSCARCSRTPSTRSTGARRSPAASRSTSWSAPTESTGPTSRACSAWSASCPTSGTSSSASGRTTRRRRGSRRRRSHEEYVRGLKALTSKPVVGVGRFTSPDTMVRMVRDGVLDMIGAARPSIADPFLPRKIEEGRLEDIRECIGCNICVSGDGTISPIRCTQNPSMGEEWRRGWHPEVMRPQDVRRVRARRRRGAGRARGGDGARQARPPRRPGRGDPGPRRPGRPRGAPAGPGGVDQGPRLPRAASSTGSPTSRSPTTAA